MLDLKNMNFVVLDVETTGLDPVRGDRIIEFAAIKLKGKEIVDHFETLINPDVEISFGAYQVNGITQDMLIGAPSPNEIIDNIAYFIKDSCWVGHNIKFDIRFLNNELSIQGVPLLENYIAIDTVKMSRGLVPQLRRFSLDNVTNYLDIKNEQQHRAMADVKATTETFLKLLQIAEDRGLHDIETILNLFGTNKINKQDSKQKMKKILNAISSKIQLRLLYNARTSGTTIRKVTPEKVLGSGNKAVLIGFCHLRNDQRFFNLNKIVRLEELND